MGLLSLHLSTFPLSHWRREQYALFSMGRGRGCKKCFQSSEEVWVHGSWGLSLTGGLWPWLPGSSWWGGPSQPAFSSGPGRSFSIYILMDSNFSADGGLCISSPIPSTLSDTEEKAHQLESCGCHWLAMSLGKIYHLFKHLQKREWADKIYLQPRKVTWLRGPALTPISQVGGREVPHDTKQFLNTSWVLYNLIQFSHYPVTVADSTG